MKRFLGILVIALLALGSVDASAQTKKTASAAKKTATTTKKTASSSTKKTTTAITKTTPTVIDKPFKGTFRKEAKTLDIEAIIDLYNRSVEASMEPVYFNELKGKYEIPENGCKCYGTITESSAHGEDMYDIVRVEIKNDKTADIWLVYQNMLDASGVLADQVKKAVAKLSPDNQTISIYDSAGKLLWSNLRRKK